MIYIETKVIKTIEIRGRILYTRQDKYLNLVTDADDEGIRSVVDIIPITISEGLEALLNIVKADMPVRGIKPRAGSGRRRHGG
ncbi:hypothetical protein TorRG33x02_233510 [Trema orientale]|uniref:Uncharacterized protein n=1 Tax=Trema orientale TaxID=63057 RepID=A0A2P5E5P5_TREOI|nr:hypothetical protein TorRG33x02_233510 [Trema orientale]